MKIKEFLDIKENILNKKVRIEHGYVSDHVAIGVITGTKRFVRDIYLIYDNDATDGLLPSTIRSIKRITVLN